MAPAASGGGAKRRRRCVEIAEAIDILENEIPHCGKKATYTESELCEAYEMAIRSLQSQLLDATS